MMPLLAIPSTNLQPHHLVLIGLGGFGIVLVQVHGREEHLLPLHMVAGPTSEGSVFHHDAVQTLGVQLC